MKLREEVEQFYDSNTDHIEELWSKYLWKQPEFHNYFQYYEDEEHAASVMGITSDTFWEFVEKVYEDNKTFEGGV